ncbi:glycoside hydrolase family 62 protein [Parathielavia appendiculata]|uniref:Alpha-L-arabinofuranosidase n=1 Tax=Parathielavia appendiculata TaxID=2587402 RepID=A0AAN6TPY7_9PEZI|nr:glycoside hydrolase family 62 protein [Parathielavia appendiculata]
MRSIAILVAAFCASAVSAVPGLDSRSSFLAARKPAPLPSSFKWKSTGPLIGPKDDGRNLAGIKDPTVVEVNGTYHVFASTAKAEGYNLVYLNFTDFAQAGSAPFYYLDQSPIGTGYRAAPQVFYFGPQKLWYLVYQNGNAAYSTNPDIGNPAGWTAPQVFYPAGMPKIIEQNIGQGYWVDMWVICDAKLCHLFSSDDNGHLYRSQTKLADFPAGMNEPVIALQDLQNKYALWEASCVYAIKGGKGKQKYLLLIEAIGSDEQRWFRAWTSDRIDGDWTALADTYENPFARSNNVMFGEGVEPWTKSISHGEVVRSLTDQTLTIDTSKPLRFLYQGMDPNGGGVEYNALPWRLALLTQIKSCT